MVGELVEGTLIGRVGPFHSGNVGIQFLEREKGILLFISDPTLRSKSMFYGRCMYMYYTVKFGVRLGLLGYCRFRVKCTQLSQGWCSEYKKFATTYKMPCRSSVI